MAIEDLSQLQFQKIGTVIKAEELKIEVPVATHGNAGSRWASITDNYQFKVGDTYVLADDKKEVTGFKSYIGRIFQLGVGVYRYNGKAFCTIREKQAKPEWLKKKERVAAAPKTPKPAPGNVLNHDSDVAASRKQIAQDLG